MRARFWFPFILLTPFAASGCLAPLLVQARMQRVESFARFDNNCSSMVLVERMGLERFKLRGCGQTLVYACHDRRAPFQPADKELIELMVTGGIDAQAPCQLVQAMVDVPVEVSSKTLQAVLPRAASTALDNADAPPASKSPTSLTTNKQLDGEEIKRLMRGWEPALRTCGLRGQVSALLHVSEAGTITMGKLETISAQGQQCCQEKQLFAQLAQPPAAPATVRYLFLLN